MPITGVDENHVYALTDLDAVLEQLTRITAFFGIGQTVLGLVEIGKMMRETEIAKEEALSASEEEDDEDE